jgi:hypothetical protein
MGRYQVKFKIFKISWLEKNTTPLLFGLSTTAESSKESTRVVEGAVYYLLFHAKYAADVPFFNK